MKKLFLAAALWLLAAPAFADVAAYYHIDPVSGAKVAVPVDDGAHALPTTGSGGSGGAATIADGADVTQGLKADAACASSATACTVNARLADIEAQITAVKNSVAGAGTTGGCTPYHAFSAASTNSTLVSTGAHTLCSLTLVNTTATLYYVRIYDLVGAPTCSSGVGAAHSYPVPASTTGAGVAIPINGFGEAYTLGLGFCITGGGADTDNTNAATGVTINASYK